MPVLPLIVDPTLTELNNLGGGMPPKDAFELGTELNDIITAINAGGGAGPWTEAANVVSLTTPGDTVNLNVGAAGELRVNGAAGAAGQVLTSSGAGVAPTWTTPASGTIGGTIAANEVAFGTGVDSIGGDSRLTWNPGTGVFEVTDVASLPFVTVNSAALTLTVANGVLPTTNTLTSGDMTVSNGAAAEVTLGVTPGVATLDSTALGGGVLNLAVGELQVNGAPGNAGEVLTSNGAGAAPTWQAPAGGGIAIGDAVGGSTATNVLYVDGANNLANTANLAISGSTTTFAGTLRTAGTGGTDNIFLYGVSAVDWFDTSANQNGAYANLDVSNNWRLVRRVSNSDSLALYLNTSNGNLAIGNNTSPTSLFNVGNSNEFQVDSNGNLVKVRNVTYSFPSAQGAASTVLSNDGAGNLSWATAATGTIGGTIAANQVAYGSGVDTVQGNANLTFNGNTLSSLGGDAATPALVTRGDVSLFTNSGNPVPYRTFAFEPDNSELVVEYDPTLGANYKATLYPDQFFVTEYTDGTFTTATGSVKTIVDGAGFAGVQLNVDGAAYTAGTIQSADFAANPAPLNLSIGELQINTAPGSAGQVLASQGSGSAPTWSAAPASANSVASAAAVTIPQATLVTVTGATTIVSFSTVGWAAGAHVTLLFSGAPLVTHSAAPAGTKLAGSVDFQAAADSILGLVFDGTNWQETFRKVA